MSYSPDQQSEGFHQKTFEFNFTVVTLSAAIYKSNPDPKKSDLLLVNTVLKDFSLNFALRAFDMEANVKLHSLIIEDKMVENPQGFKYLVTSQEISEKQAAHQTSELVRVRYSRVDGESPEFMTVHEGFAQVRCS